MIRIPGDGLASGIRHRLSNEPPVLLAVCDATISCRTIIDGALPALVQQPLDRCSLHILYQVNASQSVHRRFAGKSRRSASGWIFPSLQIKVSQ